MPVDLKQIQQAEEFRRNRDQQRLQKSLGFAAKADPSQERRVDSVARDTGIPRSTVANHYDDADAIRQSLQFNAKEVMEQTPGVALWMSDTDRARFSYDDLQTMQSFEKHQRERVDFWSNSMLRWAETGQDLTGSLIKFAGWSISGYEMMLQSAGVLQDGATPLADELRRIGQDVADTSFGAVQVPRWENFKDEPTLGNFAKFAVEESGNSLVHLAGMAASFPAYVAARSEQIGEQRATESGREMEALDIVKGAPTALTVAIIDRWSAMTALGGGGGVMRSVAREALTEYGQEQVELIGETLGTYASPTWQEAVDRGAAGAAAGGVMGGALAGAGRLTEAAQTRLGRRVREDAVSAMEQRSLDGMIESAQNMKLYQESPDRAREFLAGLDANDRIYISPDQVRAAADEGLAVPDSMREAADGTEDVAITVDQLAMDVISDNTLLERLRPHMKRTPGARTQAELDASDTAHLERVMETSRRMSENRDAVEAIHSEVVEQLVATGRLRRDEARLSAQLVPQIVVTRIEDLREQGVEMDAETFYRDYMRFRVERGEPGDGRVLSQDDTDLVQQYGAPADTRMDAERAHSRGDAIFAIDEMEEGVTRLRDIEELAAHAPERLMIVPRERADATSQPVTETEAFKRRARAAGFDVDTTHYHGTDASFDRFISGTAAGWGEGVYLTDNPVAAQEFGGNIVPVYLKKGLRLYQDENIDFRTMEESKTWKDYRESRDLSDDYYVEDAWSEDGPFVGELLRELGYDGIASEGSNGIDGMEVVVFDPKNALIENTPILSQNPARQTDTAAFKRWFGDSKVVDESGEPLVVYHGGAPDIEVFDTSDKSLRITKNSLGENIGTFFAANRNHAADFGGELYPSYLNLQNPAVFESQEDLREFMRENSGRTEDARDAEGFIVDEGVFENRMREVLISMGHDGVEIRRPGYTKSKSSDRPWYIAFEPTQIKSATGNRGTFDPNDPSILAQQQGTTRRGSIELTPEGERIIRLTEASNLSTFLHELGHLFLEVEGQLAAQYGTSTNQQAILDMLGVTSFADIQTEHHELFARTFEDYLRTGKAPTRTLRDAFAAFARWLADIYRSITGPLGLELDAETTAIFDRLLATQREIEDAAANPVYDKLFRSKEQAGMTDAQWQKYQERVQRRKDRAAATLYEKLLAELTNRRTAEWKEEKAPIIEQERERLSQEPVYLAMATIREVRLDSDAVKEALGIDKFPRAGRLKNLVKKGGEDPEVLAEEFNYGSVRDMLEAVQEAQPLKDAADTAAEAIMRARHGDILNDGSIEREAQIAMHSETQARHLLAELKALGAKTRSPRTPRFDTDYLKAKAKATVAKMNYAEMRPDKFHRAELRAAQQAGAVRTPDEQYEATLQRLANHYLYQAAVEGRRAADRYRDYARAVERRDYRSTQVAGEYIQQMKQLVKAYDTSKRPSMEKRIRRAQSVAGWIMGQRAGGVDVNIKDLALIELQAGAQTLPSFDEMSLEQLRSVYEQLRHLRYVGGRLATEQKGALQAERRGVQTRIAETGSQQAREDWEAHGDRQIKSWMQHAVHLLPSLRNLVRDLDNDPRDDGGVVFDSIYRRVARGVNKKLKAEESFLRELNDTFKNFNLRNMADTRASGIAVVREDGSKWTLSAQQRFMLGVYWGTEGSRQRIRTAFRVTDEEVLEMLSHLDDDTLTAIEGVWDHSDYMKGPVFEATITRDGVAPEELERVPFEVNGRILKGGHMRLFYEGSHGEIEGKIRLDEDPLSAINGVVAGKAASAHERQQFVNRKPLLQASNIYRNIYENAHYVGFADVSVELQTIFNNPELRAAIAEHHGAGFDLALLQNIQGLTTGLKEKESSQMVAAATRQMKHAKSMQYLAYNAKNIMQQFASVLPTLADQGPINYVTAAQAFYADFAANRAFVEGKSVQMRARKFTLNREHADAVRNVVSGSKAEAVLNEFARHGFTPHVAIDMVISYPTWLAEYQKGMERHGDEEKAIIDADVTVAETVGSGLDLHLGKIVRSSEQSYVQMLTMFLSWFISAPYQRAYRGVRGGKKWMSKPAFEALLLTPLLTAAVSEILAMNIPNWEDDDEDYFLKVASWLGLEYLGFIGSTIPVFGDFLEIDSSFRPSTLLGDAVYSARNAPGALGGAAAGAAVGSKVAGGRGAVIGGVAGSAVGAVAEAVATDAPAIETVENWIKLAGSFVAAPGSGNIVRILDYAQSAAEGEEELPETLPGAFAAGYQAVVEGRDRNE